MDFELTEEQRMIAERARKVGEKFGLDYWRNQDKLKKLPTEFRKEVHTAQHDPGMPRAC